MSVSSKTIGQSLLPCGCNEWNTLVVTHRDFWCTDGKQKVRFSTNCTSWNFSIRARYQIRVLHPNVSVTLSQWRNVCLYTPRARLPLLVTSYAFLLQTCWRGIVGKTIRTFTFYSGFGIRSSDFLDRIERGSRMVNTFASYSGGSRFEIWAVDRLSWQFFFVVSSSRGSAVTAPSVFSMPFLIHCSRTMQSFDFV
jgi:hypothetical protein